MRQVWIAKFWGLKKDFREQLVQTSTAKTLGSSQKANEPLNETKRNVNLKFWQPKRVIQPHLLKIKKIQNKQTEVPA